MTPFRLVALSVAALMSALVVAPSAMAQSNAPAASEPDPIVVAANTAPGNFGKTPAKVLFGRMKTPTTGKAEAIGFYARGCMTGAVPLPLTGPAWQVMRPSRDRYWGNPELIALIERLAKEARANDGWNGLLVGDLSQPRGGPMTSGHASHQVGLDADIWLTQMPDHKLTTDERETMSATSVIKSRFEVNPKVWSEADARLIERAASYPEVERIFVHPPIKKFLCEWAHGKGAWLAKVRAYYGHYYHFHIRIRCPRGSTSCKPQAPPRPKDGTGCGAELAYWLSDKPWRPAKPVKPVKPVKPRPPITMAQMPSECSAVLDMH